jgi:hypothetical protein
MTPRSETNSQLRLHAQRSSRKKTSVCDKSSTQCKRLPTLHARSRCVTISTGGGGRAFCCEAVVVRCQALKENVHTIVKQRLAIHTRSPAECLRESHSVTHLLSHPRTPSLACKQHSLTRSPTRVQHSLRTTHQLITRPLARSLTCNS